MMASLSKFALYCTQDKCKANGNILCTVIMQFCKLGIEIGTGIVYM